MAAALRELSKRGLRVRTRALTTTLFARLYLADLFVHGIGGAKYDEMTDEIIRRYFGTSPPAFATLSATVHLPLAGSSETVADVSRLKERLRSVEQHPEQHLDCAPGPAGRELIREFKELVEEQHAVREGRLPPREGNWYASGAGAKRYRRLQQIRRELGALTVQIRRQLAAEREAVERRVTANGVLRNREYAICLYPADKLRSFFEHASAAVR